MGAKRINPDIREKARALFIVGMGATEIAQKLGIGRHNVNSWASKGKWAAKRKHLVAVSDAHLEKRILDVTTDAVLQHQERISNAVGHLMDAAVKINIRKASDLVPLANSLRTLDDIGRRNVGLGIEEKPSANTNFHLHMGNGGMPSKPNAERVLDVPMISAPVPQPQSASPSAVEAEVVSD